MKYDFETSCGSRGLQIPQVNSMQIELLHGIGMIAAVDDITYRRKANGTGSVGAQFRHNLDFVNSLLNGIETGRIDYSQRERDIRIEENRNYAIERFQIAYRRLSDLSPRIYSKSLLIRSEIDEATWLPSSFVREAEFVHSHTVHHHALIAEKLAGFGISAPANFGVAESTLKYWNSKAA